MSALQQHYSDDIIGRWGLKSPALRLFTQPFIQAQIIANIKAPRHWPLWRNLPVTGELVAQRASNAENVSIWWRHHGHGIHLVCTVYIFHMKGQIYLCCKCHTRILISFNYLSKQISLYHVCAKKPTSLGKWIRKGRDRVNGKWKYRAPQNVNHIRQINK